MKGGGRGTQHQKQTLKRALQICNIDKAVSVLFGKVVNPCAIAYILREVTNPYTVGDVLSITQTGQTSEYTVEEYGMFKQKWLVSYEISIYTYDQRLSSTNVLGPLIPSCYVFWNWTFIILLEVTDLGVNKCK